MASIPGASSRGEAICVAYPWLSCEVTPALSLFVFWPTVELALELGYACLNAASKTMFVSKSKPVTSWSWQKKTVACTMPILVQEKAWVPLSSSPPDMMANFYTSLSDYSFTSCLELRRKIISAQ